jgi:hypothetical protein
MGVAEPLHRRLEIDNSDPRVDVVSFYDGERFAGKRLSLDDFTTRVWRRYWLEGRVADPADLRLPEQMFGGSL